MGRPRPKIQDIHISGLKTITGVLANGVRYAFTILGGILHITGGLKLMEIEEVMLIVTQSTDEETTR